MTRDQFVARWKNHLAGMALFGAVSELRDGPLARAAKVMDIPAAVESLLGKMFDDATKDQPAPSGQHANGNGNHTNGRRA
jgi:hypothetical protein